VSHSLATTEKRLSSSVGGLTQAALNRMERDLPWFRQLGAQERSWIGLIAQSGIAAFVEWYAHPDPGAPVLVDVFGTAPRDLARVVSLRHTVEMIRTTIEVVEANVDSIVDADEIPAVREAVLLYAREVAFAAAEVYARAAETRGAWDARLEALIVDSVLRGEADEAVRSRAAALGWASASQVAVVVGHAPEGDRELVADAVRRSARQAGLDTLCAVQGDRLVVVLGGVAHDDVSAASVAEHFGPGPVVIGPSVPDLLAASVSARAAVSGHRAAAGWPDAPRFVTSDDLLPERALNGDGHARRQLVTAVYAPLLAAGPTVLETVAVFLERCGSIEATGRALFVHPNTVRYRLQRASEVTGLAAGDPREAYILRLGLTLGRLLSPES
jgi:DNA-binding PucR family transcriptional regulator